jgi:hypothetical protein
MNKEPVSTRTKVLRDTVPPLIRFFEESSWVRCFGDPEACDFTLGNPHEGLLCQPI